MKLFIFAPLLYLAFISSTFRVFLMIFGFPLMMIWAPNYAIYFLMFAPVIFILLSMRQTDKDKEPEE